MNIKGKRGVVSKNLNKRLEYLMEVEMDDETLAEIIYVKLHLNLEMENEKAY